MLHFLLEFLRASTSEYGFPCLFLNSVTVRDMSWAVPWTATIGGVADSDACAGGLGHALRVRRCWDVKENRRSVEQ